MEKVDKEELKILQIIFCSTAKIINAITLFDIVESDKKGYNRIGRDKNNKVIIICHLDKYGDVELSHSTSMYILKGRSLKDGTSNPRVRYHNYYHMKKGER